MFIKNIILCMRPKQWPKNILVLAALVFSKNLFHLGTLLISLTALAIFCMISGAVYILNDLLDIEKDRQHPLKAKRPLAAGLVSKGQAIIAFVILVALSLWLSFQITNLFAYAVIVYLVIQIAYSSILKHLVIIDAFCVASGFFIRVLAGAFAINVEVSKWLILCTSFLSLFLALTKRRHELVLLEDEAKSHRAVLNKYNVLLIDQMVAVVTTSTVVTYSLYTLSQDTIAKFGTSKLMFTIPFVLYGIFRYLYLVYVKKEGGRPEIDLFSDMPTVINMVFYILTAGAILYF